MNDDTAIRELVAGAYRQERFTMTLSEIEERVTGRRRDRWKLALAAAVALALIAGLVGWQLGNRPKPTPPAHRDRTFDYACRDEWQQVSKKPEAALPVMRFRLGGEADGTRIYADDKILLECQRRTGVTKIGAMYAMGSLFHLNTTDKIGYFAHYATADEPSYLVGELPEKATALSATLSNGVKAEAVISERLFVIWHPSVSLRGAQLLASNADGAVAAAEAPSQPAPIFNEPGFDAACRNTGDEGDYRDAEVLTHMYSEPYTMLVYLSPAKALKCSYASTPNVRGFDLVTATVGDAKTLRDMDMLGHISSATGDAYIAIGRAPEAAESVVVELSDGRTVQATIRGTVFFATWTSSATTPVTAKKVTAVAQGKTYIRTDGKLTVS